MIVKEQIVLIGCGKMGEALLKGWLKEAVSKPQIIVVEPNAHASIAKTYDVKAVASYAEAKDQLADHIIVLAVKPQIVENILPEFKQNKDIKGMISIAAGKTTHFFEQHLGKSTACVRAMPNLPATIGRATTGLYANTHADKSLRTCAENLFTAVGTVFWLEDEIQMDAITAISGSGPAYVYYFIECLEKAAIELGLPSDIAKQIARSTVIGSTALAEQSKEEVTTLRQNVTSPGGTTEAALRVLQDKQGLEKLVVQAVKAAHKRAQELSL